MCHMISPHYPLAAFDSVTGGSGDGLMIMREDQGIRLVSAGCFGLNRAISGRAHLGCSGGAAVCSRATWCDIRAARKEAKCAETKD